MINLNSRQSEIYHMVKERSVMKVRDIISLFDVSAATIRKDLTLLEESGLLRRTHGEVHAIAQNGLQMTPFEARSFLCIEAKRKIAQAAAQQINDGESIILDSGSTTAEIAKLLVDRKNLTVITNSLPVALALSSSAVTVIIVGGMFLGQNISIQGPDAEAFLQQIEADKAFISATGVRNNIGLTASNPLEASIKKCMIHAAHKVYAVLDSSKFSIGSINLFADFSEIDTLITEALPDDLSLTQRFDALGTQIILADS